MYLLRDGSAKLGIGDEVVDLEPGDAVWVDPHDSRTLRFEENDSRTVIAGAP